VAGVKVENAAEPGAKLKPKRGLYGWPFSSRRSRQPHAQGKHSTRPSRGGGAIFGYRCTGGPVRRGGVAATSGQIAACEKVLTAKSDAAASRSPSVEASWPPLMANYDAAPVPANSVGQKFAPAVAAMLRRGADSEIVEGVDAELRARSTRQRHVRRCASSDAARRSSRARRGLQAARRAARRH